MDIAWFEAGKNRPVLRSPRKVDGREPAKPAEALMAYDLQRLVRMPMFGPNRAKGMRKVNKAHWYEIWSVPPHVKRVRQWVCSAGRDSCGIRVEYRVDTKYEIHPELTEFRKTFKVETR
ncbi:MAG: hypothetical protein ACYTHK_08075 [Planctomycetota bacterium]